MNSLLSSRKIYIWPGNYNNSMLEKIVTVGKQTILPLVLSSILGCSTAIRARQDYEQYPGYRKDIAFYNMEQIGKQICPIEFELTEEKFNCKYAPCAVADPVTYQCLSLGETVEKRFQLKDVESIDKHFMMIEANVHLKDGSTINLTMFRSTRQASDFIEAMQIYLEK